MSIREAVLVAFLAALLPLTILFVGTLVRFPLRYMDEVSQNAGGLPPALVLAVIQVESGFRPSAVSRQGATGLMQLMPATAQENAYIFGLEGFSQDMLMLPDVNINLGSLYLSRLIDYFGEQTLALAAYNAGRGNVRRWLSDPDISADGFALDSIPFPETHNYLRRVRRGVLVYRVRLIFWNSGIYSGAPGKQIE